MLDQLSINLNLADLQTRTQRAKQRLAEEERAEQHRRATTALRRAQTLISEAADAGESRVILRQADLDTGYAKGGIEPMRILKRACETVGLQLIVDRDADGYCLVVWW